MIVLPGFAAAPAAVLLKRIGCFAIS